MSLWAMVASGVGYHLDNFGRWLLASSPALGGSYAALLAPAAPRPHAYPNWRFAQEYYEERRWLACRRGALWEEAARRSMSVTLTLRWYNDSKVEVSLGNDNSLCLYVCGSFEPNEFAFLDQILRPGMTVVDVGANDGYYAVFAACRVGPQGRVIAVEPSSRERINLRRNVERNRLENVTVVPVALGAATGTAELRLAEKVHSGHNTFGAFANDGVAVDSVEKVEVRTLDDVVASHGLAKVDFIKVDVEGAEAAVISGARATLGAQRPILLLEISDRALQAQHTSAEKLLGMLRGEFGYEIMVFSGKTGRIVSSKSGEPLSSNVVALPAERLDTILADSAFER